MPVESAGIAVNRKSLGSSCSGLESFLQAYKKENKITIPKYLLKEKSEIDDNLFIVGVR